MLEISHNLNTSSYFKIHGFVLWTSPQCVNRFTRTRTRTDKHRWTNMQTRSERHRHVYMPAQQETTLEERISKGNRFTGSGSALHETCATTKREINGTACCCHANNRESLTAFAPTHRKPGVVSHCEAADCYSRGKLWTGGNVHYTKGSATPTEGLCSSESESNNQLKQAKLAAILIL